MNYNILGVLVFCFLNCAMVLADTPNHNPQFFSRIQEEYLAEHPELYAYFNHLYPDQKTPAQIGQEFNLSTEENIEYLNQLYKIGLIEKPDTHNLSLHPRFVVHGISSYDNNGPLSKKISGLMLNQICEKMHQDLKIGKNHTDKTLGLWVTETQYQGYLKELDELNNKYLQISYQNRNTKTPSAYRVFGLFSLIPNWEPPVFTEVKNKQSLNKS